MKKIQALGLAMASIFYLSGSAITHAQTVRTMAIAIPLTGITIDGKIDDWPENMERHPIIHHGQAYGSTDIEDADLTASPDLTPSFMTGYDKGRNLLYIAVIVRDDSLKSGFGFSRTDGCEIYVEGTKKGKIVDQNYSQNYTPEKMAAIQYVLCPPGGSYDSESYGDDARNPRISGGNMSDTKTTAAFSRDGDISIYEWAIQAFDVYPSQPTKLIPGKVVGLDVVVNDVDDDGRPPAWVCWAQYKPLKFFDATSLGSILIVGNAEDVGTVVGVVTNELIGGPFNAFEFSLFSGEELVRTGITDNEGRFSAQLMKGNFILKASVGQGLDTNKTKKFTVKAGKETKIDFTPEYIDIPDILIASSEMYKSLESYKDTTVVEIQTETDKGKEIRTKKFSFEFQRPVNIRLKIAGGDSNNVSLIGYDQVFLAYDEVQNLYDAARPPVSYGYIDYQRYLEHISGDSRLFLEFITAADPLKDLLKTAISFKDAGKERLNGTETIMIEAMIPVSSLNSAVPLDVMKPGTPVKVCLWFGNEDNYLYRISYSLDFGGKYKKEMKTFTIGHSSFEPNPSFPENYFMFSPQPGAMSMAQRGRVQDTKPKEVDLNGSEAPGFDLPCLGGDNIALADLKGKVVVLDFWASWSVPCEETMPGLQKLSERYRGKDVAVIGIDTLEEEDEDYLKEFLDGLGITYIIALDTGQKLADAFHLTKVPTCFVIDKQGIVQYTFKDEEYDTNAINGLVAELLKK